jgi:hypothetical protein
MEGHLGGGGCESRNVGNEKGTSGSGAGTRCGRSGELDWLAGRPPHRADMINVRGLEEGARGLAGTSRKPAMRMCMRMALAVAGGMRSPIRCRNVAAHRTVALAHNLTRPPCGRRLRWKGASNEMSFDQLTIMVLSSLLSFTHHQLGLLDTIFSCALASLLLCSPPLHPMSREALRISTQGASPLFA